LKGKIYDRITKRQSKLDDPQRRERATIVKQKKKKKKKPKKTKKKQRKGRDPRKKSYQPHARM